jgi:hypothetical protein
VLDARLGENCGSAETNDNASDGTGLADREDATI